MILPALIEAAVEVQLVLSAGGIRSCVIGGLAVQRWGEPRATQDVDFSVLAPIGEEQDPLDVLLNAFASRRADTRAFAIANRVLLIEATNKVAVDVGLAGSPFEVEILDRSSAWDVALGISIVTCSAEDLVTYNLVAGRARDVADIEGIVRRHGAGLDVDRMRRYGQLLRGVNYYCRSCCLNCKCYQCLTSSYAGSEESAPERRGARRRPQRSQHADRQRRVIG